MSTFKVDVIKVTGITKHPNADTLSIVQVFGQNCIFRTGEFNEGDLAVYVPYDSVVPLTDPKFSFLDKGKGAETMRIKPVRLRGEYSEGILIKPQSGMKEGDDVAAILGIIKYEEPEERVRAHHQGPKAAPAVKDPGIAPKYDMESFHRYGNSFQMGELVIITEKIHGCNFRAVYHDGQLYVGSHNLFREAPREGNRPRAITKGITSVLKNLRKDIHRSYATPVLSEQGVYGYEDFSLKLMINNIRNRYLVTFNKEIKPVEADTWWKMAIKYDLETKLKKNPDVVLYGEVYGNVQDLTYSVPEDESIRLAAFDLFDSKSKTYLDHDIAMNFCYDNEIPVVPELYRGPLSKEIVEELTADFTKSYIDGKTMREGIVIRPAEERRDHNGRIVMKVVSRQYKSRNGGTEKH